MRALFALCLVRLVLAGTTVSFSVAGTQEPHEAVAARLTDLYPDFEVLRASIRTIVTDVARVFSGAVTSPPMTTSAPNASATGATNTTQAAAPSADEGLSWIAITGIVLGSLAAVALIVGLSVYYALHSARTAYAPAPNKVIPVGLVRSDGPAEDPP